MDHLFDIVAIVGSLRQASISRLVARALAAQAGAALPIELLSIGHLPLYDQDAESAPPAEWSRFRERVRRADAVLFVTPEYNRSIPGGLKNALDVGSRPFGRSVWAGKPAAIVSQSPGSLGGFGAHHHLRQCLVALDMPTLQQPEMYLGRADKLVDASGTWSQPGVRELSVTFLSAFEAWIRRQTCVLEPIPS